MKKNLCMLTVVLLFSCFQLAVADSQSLTWKLPTQLTDFNTKLTFQVDSTWHMVHGVSSGIHGSVHQDGGLFGIDVDIPVGRLDTDNSSRDERLREIMQEKKFHNISFHSNHILSCTSAMVMRDGVCETNIEGKLKMLSTEKAISVPIHIEYNRGKNTFEIDGHTKFLWPDFGIEDPSIFIASVDPDVEIFFHTTIPAEQKEAE